MTVLLPRPSSAGARTAGNAGHSKLGGGGISNEPFMVNVLANGGPVYSLGFLQVLGRHLYKWPNHYFFSPTIA